MNAPAARRQPLPRFSSTRKPQVQWTATGRLIDSLHEDLVESYETATKLRTVPPAARQAESATAPRQPAAAAPVRSEPEDSTDVMTSLPRMSEDGVPEDADEPRAAHAVPPPCAPKILSVVAPKPRPAARLASVIERGSLPSRASLSAIDTALLTLSPTLLDALKRTAPKKRHAKLPYVFAVALAGVLGVLAADVSTRDFVAEKAHETAAFLGL